MLKMSRVAVLVGFLTGSCPLALGAAPPPNPGGVQPPLSTRGQWIIDNAGQRVKLKGVNWYGASDGYNVVGGLDKSSIANIAALIRDLGFNSVRLPFSHAMLRAPAVAPDKVAANLELAGALPLTVYDAVIKGLTDQGLMVILNNHTTSAVWCCGQDENALWFNDNFSAEQWMRDWEVMVARYSTNPLVVAADLRNELRKGPLGSPNWGSGDAFDWHDAAQVLGDRLLKVNSNLLIIVEGLSYATDFSNVAATPITLAVPNKVVYSPHNYSWFRGGDEQRITYESVRDGLDRQWRFIATGSAGLKAPVWIGEFGAGPSDDRTWFTYYIRYLRENDLDWCVWPLNVGPKASGEVEVWGLLTDDWQHPLADWRIQLLRTIL